MTRVAIVTGAAQGIGRSIALRLASDGIDIAINDLPSQQALVDVLVQQITESGQRAIAVLGDVSSQHDVQSMVNTTVELLGNLDIMVANAGVLIKPEPILDDIFDKTMAINCKGTLYCYKHAAAQMIQQGKGGRIIGASSMAGLQGSIGNVSYTTSKFAIRAITQTAALEWGKYNITVNAYAPGLIDTPASSAARDTMPLVKDLQDQLVAGTCVKRIGKPDDVASLVSFLASEEASYVTGFTPPSIDSRHLLCSSTMKVAIVTGAAQGIGRAIALQLGSHGIDVAVNDISQKQEVLEGLVKEIEAMGRKALAVTADVSKEAEVQDMVKRTVENFGELNIMVANAGITGTMEPLLEVSEKAFDQTMAINCKGTLYCYRAAASQMIKQGKGGRIIGASSICGRRASPGSVAYNVSKFAIRAITQTAALEWGQHNITVNAYAPGVIDTEMTDLARRAPGMKEFQDQIVANICVKRKGTPEDLASLVNFLASDGASYITGQTLSVDGGFWLS
ncbi:Enoyl-(Acyl carrier protein) reductase [Ceratobasidium sp. AG-Ba]|nr:Enoyl-(Acyl carrier protein) reductase [Ceratobasidium sp. AG-Ba]QRW11638.1 Enoyl-(Acyl carrier protein) reductase [Ceratobasidium sp. AG-Ba]